MKDDLRATMLYVLKESKEYPLITSTSDIMKEILEQIGAVPKTDCMWEVSREQRIEIALKIISLGEEPENVVKNMNWKDFEGLVAQILTENNYRCTESFRRRGTSSVQGMEIDVVGVKGNSIIAIDAKMWGIRTGKASALMTAVTKQIERTERLSNQLHRLSKKIDGMKPRSYILMPVMVTWLVEEVELHEGVPVVPVFKLNSFLNEIDRFEDFVLTFNGVLQPQMEQTKL